MTETILFEEGESAGNLFGGSETAVPVPEEPSRGSSKGIGVLAWLSIGWLVGLLVLAIAAPLLPIPGPREVFPEMARKGPTLGHPFGGDAIGRDVLSRIIYRDPQFIHRGFRFDCVRFVDRRNSRSHDRLLPRKGRQHSDAADERAVGDSPVRTCAVARDRVGDRR